MPDKTATHAGEKGSAAVRKPAAEAQASRRQATPVHPAAALLRAMSGPASELTASDILALQRTAGNRAVAEMLAQSMPLEPPDDERQRRLTIQAKLAVGAADDQYEREADRVAAQVMQRSESAAPQVQRQPSAEKDDEEKMIRAKPLAAAITPLVQRQEMAKKEDEEEETPIQRRGIGTVTSAEPGVERGIEQARAGGQPLPDELRARMEQAFGADFSRVRVHADGEADRLNRALESRAFITGHDLFFKRGEYNSGSPEGQKLIAHELTHVIQQTKAQAAVVAERKPHGKARSINLSRAGNNFIQRNGPAQAAQPAPRQNPYDRKAIEAIDEEVENIKDDLANKAREKELVSGLFTAYETAWQTLRSGLGSLPVTFWPLQRTNFEAAKKKLTDARAQLVGLDATADALEDKHRELKARLDPHKKIAADLDETLFGGKAKWLLSYNEDKKQAMSGRHNVIKPVVEREQREFESLDKAKKDLDEIKPSKSEEGQQVAVAREIDAARTATSNVTPGSEEEKRYFRNAGAFIKDLETAADTKIKGILENATKNNNQYLDITDQQVGEIKEKWKESKLYKGAAEARIRAAAKIQHEPTKDAWFTKLGLVNKAETYNWVEAGTVGGDRVHETLYRAQVTEADIVTPSLGNLKNQVLGQGAMGYHITLETTERSDQNSHAYRGFEIIRYQGYQEKYSDEKGALTQGALTIDQLRDGLRNKRDGCVARVEASVQNAQENKGRGMMTQDVAKKLNE